MRKKVIVLTISGILALSGVVSAASMWGTYKGNDIVRLTVDGIPVKVSDVPAISYNDRTMVPIYLLQQAGVNYTWDAANKTVKITTTPPTDSQTIRNVPISWLKLYSSASNLYMNYSEMGLTLDILHGSIFTAMDYSINGDPTTLITSSTGMYNDATNYYNWLNKTASSVGPYMSSNGLSPEFDQLSQLVKKALDHYENALTAISRHKITKSNADFADYQSEMSVARNAVIQAKKLSNDEYNKYYNLIQNYQ